MIKKSDFFREFKSDWQAEMTNRLIPGDESFHYPEWSEDGLFRSVPVRVYYRTTPDDQGAVDESGGDWRIINWPEQAVEVCPLVDACDDAGIDIDAFTASVEINDLPWGQAE